MDVTYQVSDKDFNFFKTQVRELNAERNRSVLTSIFRTITGTRHKQEECKLLVFHQCL